MAKEKGFYKDVGLDVDIQEVDPKKSYLDFLNQTPASYAIMDSSGILQRLKGSPIVALGAIYQQSPNVLISLKESNIQDINQLRGKRLMANLEDQDASILVALQKEGLSKLDFTLLPFSYNYNDLIEGKVDVMSTYITDTPYILKSKGLKYNIIDPLAYGINFYVDMVYTSEEEAQNNPLRAKSFMESSIKGWEYALNNINETIGVIRNKYASKSSYDKLEYEAMMSQQMIMAERIPLGQIGGEIVLESPSEGGSLFTLKLYHVEIALTNPKNNKSLSHYKTSFHQELVLAVDDIEDNLVLIETLLQGYGFEVISTNDPEKSIELAKQFLPKLIFMDIKMPKMDGYEVTDILKNLPETKHIPIIAVSASVLGEKEEAMRRGLFDAFVSKPINTRELEEAISLFIEHTENNDELYSGDEKLNFHLSMPEKEKKVLVDYVSTRMHLATGAHKHLAS